MLAWQTAKRVQSQSHSMLHDKAQPNQHPHCFFLDM